ncbi:gp16 family protein [Pasteurella multocida]|uniref:gp16 family protein n=1 Tax=Pasteurella multocida TaxID=747 RepID=UPI00292EE079|nr:regulatory protein GemA [Pasteurella multocida]WNY75953.1 regulatory protein GemA [Pasteurella multocida]
MYTKPKYIQLIHIAKKQLGIDEISYQQMLERITGKNSTKQMTIKELDKVLSELEEKGFNNSAKKSRRSSSKTVKPTIVDKIRVVWRAMHANGIILDGSDQALNQFVHNIVNVELSRKGNNFLVIGVGALKHDTKLATIVLERLKKWQKRVEVKNG